MTHVRLIMSVICRDYHPSDGKVEDRPSRVGSARRRLNRGTRAPFPVVVAAVTNGLPWALPLWPVMLGFKGVLTKQQIEDVAAFIFKYQGTRKTCEECAAVQTP
jgi:hypothetical protein